MPAANLYQVVLGASCLEITPEPVANNATTLIPWAHVSGVFPVTIQEKQVSDDTWRYRFNSAVIMHIQISDGNSLKIELQEITNQPTWTGNLAGQKQALSDINASLPPSGGGGYDADAQLYFDELTGTVSNDVKTLVNNLVVTLKDDGNWPYIDHLPLMNMPNEQNAMVNLKSPSDPLMVNYNSCVHTPYIGIAGNGTNAYIDTNYNPSTYGGNYTLNSASISVFSKTEYTGFVSPVGFDSATGTAVLVLKTGTSFLGVLNANFSGLGNTNSSSIGFFHLNRSSATNSDAYLNGVFLGTELNNSTGISNLNNYLFAVNSNGTPNFIAPHQLALYSIGSGQINPATFNTAITTFVNAMAAL
jgi:hypothetical protein